MSDGTLFAIDDPARSALDAELAEMAVGWGRRTRVTTTVLDTFDGRLHAAGLRLDLRHDGGRRLQLSGADVPDQPLAGRTLPGRVDTMPPGSVGDVVRPLLGIRSLLAQGVVTSQRATATIIDDDGSPVTELAIHTAVRLDALAPVKPALLEVRALPGGRRGTRRLAAQLTGLGLPRLDADLVAAAFAEHDRSFAGFDNFPVVPLDPDAPSAAGFRIVLSRLAVAIDANWDGTVARTDPEFLHDFRVAIRRTRTLLSAGRQVLPDVEADQARVRLGWLATQTSLTRDLDVYVLEWGRYTAGLDASVVADLDPLRRLLDQRLDEEYARLAEVFAAPSARALLSDWSDWLQRSHTEVGELGHQPLGATVAQLVLRAHRVLLQRGRLIAPDTPAEQVHDLRKDAKRLRYLLECFASLMPADARRRFVKRLTVLQDNLGEHQDAEVHVAQLAEFARKLQERGVGHETLLAIGRLTERQDRRRSSARRAFTDRFAEYDTKATTNLLFEAIDHIR